MDNQKALIDFAKEINQLLKVEKSQIEDKNLSLGGAMGITPRNSSAGNDSWNNNAINNSVSGGISSGEDLGVPLDLNVH